MAQTALWGKEASLERGGSGLLLCAPHSLRRPALSQQRRTYTLLSVAWLSTGVPEAAQGPTCYVDTGCLFLAQEGILMTQDTPAPEPFSGSQLLWLHTDLLHWQPKELPWLGNSLPQRGSTGFGAGDSRWWTCTPEGSCHLRNTSFQYELRAEPSSAEASRSLPSGEPPVSGRLSRRQTAHSPWIIQEGFP